MKYRRVGDKDLIISEIGFGCGGNAGLMVREEAKDQIAVIERALERGITYFDNAPDYGNGKAEANLGRVLKELRVRPVINSKVEIRAVNLDDIAGHVVRSAEASLTRLGIEQLDVFQVHNGPSRYRPRLEGEDYRQLWLEDFLRPGGACEGIDRLKQAGKIRHAGFICRGDDADAVTTLLDTGLFSLINVPYTVLNPTAGLPKPQALQAMDFGNVIEIAQGHGVGAAIYSPLAGGVLTDAFLRGTARHPLARAIDTESPEMRDIAARAAKLAFLPDSGESLAQAAYRFVLSNPGVATVLGGFSAVEQVEELCAASGHEPIALEKMRRLAALWESNFDG